MPIEDQASGGGHIDQLVPGDHDGDGKTDQAVWPPTRSPLSMSIAACWALLLSSLAWE